MEIHVHSQDWKVLSYQCSVYIQDAMLITASFKQFDAISKEINSCGQRECTKTKMVKPWKDTKDY